VQPQEQPGARVPPAHSHKDNEEVVSNPHDQPARTLVILTPDIGAQYFREIAEVANTPGGLSPARMVDVMTRYGLVLAPPKLPTAAP
jgi:hypothetical protein